MSTAIRRYQRRKRAREQTAGSSTQPETPEATNLTLPTGKYRDGIKGQRGSIALVRRAIREDWNIPQSLKDKAIAYCEWLLDHPEDAKTTLAAVQSLISADNVNCKRESTDTQADAAEGRLLQAQLQAVLADPVLAERLLGGPPPQVSPTPDDTSEPVNGKPHS